MWVKATTALDVLSGGRAWLGIGAAWNEEESRGLGFPFPSLGERFELLEETLQYAHAMWEATAAPAAFEGKHPGDPAAQLAAGDLAAPAPIMIGGGGERKTLRLVAQYADACNVFGDPQRIHHKYEVLREHCEAIGRDPDEIERSTLQSVKVALDDKPGDSPAQIIDWFGELGDAGAQHVIFGVRDVWDPRVIESSDAT